MSHFNYNRSRRRAERHNAHISLLKCCAAARDKLGLERRTQLITDAVVLEIEDKLH